MGSWQARLDATLSDPALNSSLVEVDDERMADIAAALGARTTWNAHEISVMLEANQTAVGIALIGIAAVLLVVMLPVSGWTLKLARARASARVHTPANKPKRPPKFRAGKDWSGEVTTPLTPQEPHSPHALELVSVEDNGFERARYLSPRPPPAPKESPRESPPPRRKPFRNNFASRRPPAPPRGTPPSEDSVTFFRRGDSTEIMSEDDWSPEHRHTQKTSSRKSKHHKSTRESVEVIVI